MKTCKFQIFRIVLFVLCLLSVQTGQTITTVAGIGTVAFIAAVLLKKNVPFARSISALLLIVCSLLYGPSATAQSWAWGRGCSRAGLEGWCVATDHTDNVWGGGFSDGTSPLTFGSY